MMDSFTRYELIDQEDFNVSPSIKDFLNTSSGISFPYQIDFDCFSDKASQGLQEDVSLPSTHTMTNGEKPPHLFSMAPSPTSFLPHRLTSGYQFPRKEPVTVVETSIDPPAAKSIPTVYSLEDMRRKSSIKSVILTSECIEIMKRSRQLNEMEGGPKQMHSAFQFNPIKKRKVRSNPREWRIMHHNLTKDQCIQYLKYHRWKEPVTNAPKGTGCRVSQCAIHSGCNHLLKMR